jgi:hypothetical protein
LLDLLGIGKALACRRIAAEEPARFCLNEHVMDVMMID